MRSLCALPKEAATVWQKIKAGARSRYAQDGETFSNAERLLPRHNQGYYHEFTVPTPGSKDRGARRLIAGGGQELYYTGDRPVFRGGRRRRGRHRLTDPQLSYE